MTEVVDFVDEVVLINNAEVTSIFQQSTNSKSKSATSPGRNSITHFLDGNSWIDFVITDSFYHYVLLERKNRKPLASK